MNDIKFDTPSAEGVNEPMSPETLEQNETELYDLCFPKTAAPAKREIEPRTIFARVLRQIETMELKVRAPMELETLLPRGYVFAIHQVGSKYVTIGHCGRSHLQSILARLQVGNPNRLEVIAVLQRYSFDDARALCETIHMGMMIYSIRGRSWFTMEDCKRRIINMFSQIDRIDQIDLLP